jgi:CBS domain-containing protein
MTTARELMTSGADYLSEDATVAEAAQRLADATDGAVPVCDEHGHLRGMVTDRDLVVGVVAAGKIASDTRLIDLIRGEVVTVSVDDSAAEVLATMTEHKVRRLPVVDGNKLVGMLSQADLARGVSSEGRAPQLGQ